MKKANITVYLFLFSFVVAAQNQSIDAVKNISQKMQHDTATVIVLNGISSRFLAANRFDSAFSYAKASIELCEKLHFISGQIIAYYNLAEYNFHIKEYKTGKLLLIKSLKAALLVNDKQNIANDYKQLADLYDLQSNFKKARESNAQYILYRDSLAKEASDKHALKTSATNHPKEKEKINPAAGETTILAKTEAKKQRVFYMSLIVLGVLSILIIWWMISRSKPKAKKNVALLNGDEKVSKNEVYKNAEVMEKTYETNATTNQMIIEEPALSEKTTKLEIEQSPSKQIEPMEETEAPTVNERYSDIIFSNQLVHFMAKLVDEKIKLSWKTTDEKKMVSFKVEKSVDAAMFLSIETIATKGLNGNEYEIFDLKPLPHINYYRLKIIDRNGNFIYGPVAQVYVIPASTLALVCYPTYAKDVIMVTAAGGRLPVLVNIYNAIGKKQFTIEVPPTTTPIYLPGLANGKYSVQMKCEGKTVLQQLIVAQ